MVENGTDSYAKTCFAGATLVAKCVWKWSCIIRSAIRASWLIGPSDLFKVFYAIRIGGEGFINGYDIHNVLQV